MTKKSINEYIHMKIIILEEWENHFHALYDDAIIEQGPEQKPKNRTNETKDKQFKNSQYLKKKLK